MDEFVVMLGVFLALFPTLGLWVYRDAQKRGSDWAWQWGFGLPFTLILSYTGYLYVLAGPLAFLILYLLVRDEMPAA